MSTLTIFTPAYNRAHTIGRTYESLCRQTCKDFEWLVIDDGSTDGTRGIVESFIREGRIPIRYIHQENQGMHGAHNTAYSNISTELNTCVDSDDYMPDEAVEKIVTFWKNLTDEQRERYAGIIGLDYADGGGLIGTEFPKGMTETTLQEFYEKGGKGDKKLVYRTDVIRRYPKYPLFKGERYVGLAYKYLLVDQDFRMLTLNEPLVIVDYQPDGSSNNMYKQYWHNPKGFAFYRRIEMVTARNLKRRFMVCVHYVSSSIIGRNVHFVADSPCKALTVMAVPFGFILFIRIWLAVIGGRKMKVANIK